MSLFKRRKRDPIPATPKQRLPDVYISSHISLAGLRSMRFFVTEEFRSDETIERLGNNRTLYSPGVMHPGVRELLAEIKSATSARYVNLHKYYIALHWDFDESLADAAEAVTQLLARHFDWGTEPVVGSFSAMSDRRWQIAAERGVDWGVGT